MTVLVLNTRAMTSILIFVFYFSSIDRSIIFSCFFFNDTATTEIYTRSIVGSVRCVQETVIGLDPLFEIHFNVAGVSFEMIDSHRFIQVLAPAGHLTQGRAYSPDNRWKGISLFDHLDGTPWVVVPDQPHILPDINTRWTCPPCTLR
eukprot:TRINITY_DN54613_c0_g1_i1.p2 TRINITY_DN54613_c0_g1~~TRINITY_DN54613_c0_g1_i1.p2  ORF type:complete len:147 (+),score=17.92 TRINITY_DN54613_c0_g1_i1:2-442(+)